MDTSEWILETHKCCSCERPLKETGTTTVNMMQLGYKATWAFPTFGNVILRTSGIAGAVVCDECLENKAMEVKFAIEYTGDGELDEKEIIYHPVATLEKITT